MLEISELQNVETSTNFLKLYESEIEQQKKIFKITDLKNLAEKVAAFKTPTLLKQYFDRLFAENFISFSHDEKLYIEELISSRSRKKTKIEYLTKVLERLSFGTQLLKDNSFHNEALQKEISEVDTFIKKELQKLAT